MNPDRRSAPGTAQTARVGGKAGRQLGAVALQVVLVYAAFAALWILVSDRVVVWIFEDPERIALASTIKGWLFVAVTTLMLFAMLRRAETPAHGEPLPKTLASLPFLLMAVAIVVAAAVAAGHTFVERRRQEVAVLQSVADLKVHQLSDWIVERLGDAEFVQSSREIAGMLNDARRAGATAEGARLRARLAGLLESHGFLAVTHFDAVEARAWGSPGAPAVDAGPLRDAVQAARRGPLVQRVGPYRDTAGKPRLDFAVPLAAAPGEVAVLHVDPEARLYPMLQDWHVPTKSGETVLFRREGSVLVVLNSLRHRSLTPLDLRAPVSDPDLLAAQAVRGEVAHGQVVTGRDYRMVPSIGVVREVPGTDWLLVAKMDRAEVYGPALAQAVWIGLAAVLGLFVAGVGLVVLRQRERLAMSEDVRKAQGERLQAMQLLDVIAHSSTDAIFAKDAAGRYLLFNRESERVTGRQAAEVMGKDDRSLFEPGQAAQLMANDRRVMQENATLSFEENLDTRDGAVTYLATKGPLRDATGAPVGMFGISRDITERKRVERALRESEARFRALFESASVAITIHDVDTGAVVDANRRALDGFGYGTLAELLEAGDPGASPYAGAAGLARIRAAAEQGPQRFEWKGENRHGREVWEDVLLERIDLDGVPRVIAVSIDITASKAAEEAMRRQADKLKAYADELERFNRATVGRELDMIALKREVNALAALLGRAPPYPSVPDTEGSDR